MRLRPWLPRWLPGDSCGSDKRPWPAVEVHVLWARRMHAHPGRWPKLQLNQPILRGVPPWPGSMCLCCKMKQAGTTRRDHDSRGTGPTCMCIDTRRPESAPCMGRHMHGGGLPPHHLRIDAITIIQQITRTCAAAGVYEASSLIQICTIALPSARFALLTCEPQNLHMHNAWAAYTRAKAPRPSPAVST